MANDRQNPDTNPTNHNITELLGEFARDFRKNTNATVMLTVFPAEMGIVPTLSILDAPGVGKSYFAKLFGLRNLLTQSVQPDSVDQFSSFRFSALSDSEVDNIIRKIWMTGNQAELGILTHDINPIEINLEHPEQ